MRREKKTLEMRGRLLGRRENYLFGRNVYGFPHWAVYVMCCQGNTLGIYKIRIIYMEQADGKTHIETINRLCNQLVLFFC